MLDLLYPGLSRGTVAALCPSVQKGSSNTVIDQSPWNNNGTLVIMDPGTSWEVIGGKRALRFNGTNDYVDVPVKSSLQVNTFTYAAWIYSTVAGSNLDTQNVITYGTGGSAYAIYLSVGGQKVNLYHVGPSTWLTGNTVMSLNTWNHIAGSWDGFTRKVWLNGVLDNEVADTTATVTGSTVRIGFRVDGLAGSYFSGGINDVRICNRAITPQEIRLLAIRQAIAYERGRPTRMASIAAAGSSRRNNMLTGMAF